MSDPGPHPDFMRSQRLMTMICVSGDIPQDYILRAFDEIRDEELRARWRIEEANEDLGKEMRSLQVELNFERERLQAIRDKIRTAFVECDTCRTKPGSPILCGGCLKNRSLITQLTGEVS